MASTLPDQITTMLFYSFQERSAFSVFPNVAVVVTFALCKAHGVSHECSRPCTTSATSAGNVCFHHIAGERHTSVAVAAIRDASFSLIASTPTGASPPWNHMGMAAWTCPSGRREVGKPPEVAQMMICAATARTNSRWFTHWPLLPAFTVRKTSVHSECRSAAVPTVTVMQVPNLSHGCGGLERRVFTLNICFSVGVVLQ